MKAVRFLAGLIACVLILVGVAVAVLLGPDDTWGGEPAALSDAVPVITTAPRLLNVAGVELTVTASAGEGEVFIGASHPVHVQDYVSQVARTEVTELGGDGIGGTALRAGERAYPAAPPTGLDVWSRQAAGPGEQVLAVPLTKTAPVQVVVMPTVAKGDAPQVGIGYTLPGAFVGGIVAALLGVLLLAGTIVLGRRAKRRRVQDEPARVSGQDSVGSEPTVERESPRVLSRGATRIALIGTLTALVAGCSVPQQVDHGNAPGVVPLAEADAQEVLDDYDLRNNAAIKKSHVGDGSLWKTADTGPMLALDDLAAKTDKVDPPKDVASPFTHTATSVFETEQPGYPLWSVMGIKTSISQEGGPRLYVLSKERVDSDWKGYSAVRLGGDLVTPLPAAEATPSDKDRERAATVGASLEEWLETGKGSDLRMGATLPHTRDELSKTDKGIQRIAHSAQPWGGGDDRDPQENPLLTVRVKQGLLVISHLEWERRMYLDADWEWTQDTTERKIFGPQASDTVNDQHFTLTTAILVPDSGPASVIGADAQRVLDFPR